MLEWSSPYSGELFVALTAGVVALIVVARWTAISERLRSWTLFVPRVLVLSLLLLVLLNPVRRKEHRLPDQPAHALFLVDSSRSMALEQPQCRSQVVQQTIQEVDSQLQRHANRPSVQLFRFGQQLASAADASQLGPQDDATRLCEALEQLPSRFSRELPRAIVVFSDGAADDAERLGEVAEAYRALKIPIHVVPVGSSQVRGDVAIDELVVPPRVDAGVKAPIRGVLRSTGYDGERVVLQVKAADRPQLPPLATLPMTLSKKPQPFELIVEANPEYGELLLEAPPIAGEVTEQNNRVPFQLSKASRKLKVIYMEGTGGDEYRWVHNALQEDKDIECLSMVADQQYVQRPRLLRVGDSFRGFPATREELLQYDCVICSDISIGAFTREQLDWVVELVAKRGGGFAMVGGITSFGAGGWDQTVWDQLIPVDMTGGALGRGWLYHQFRVTVPEESLSHPIWRIVEDPLQNRRVLAAMPQFLGTNYMQRLKPAATALAMSATPIPQAGIMPIFAVQTYGRGRSFAFAPDTTADWGRFFESQWGEADNRYFRRFWRNVVRWLTENSTAGGKRLQIETDRVIYRAGQPIVLTAHAFDDQLNETTDYDLVAQWKATTPAAAPGTLPTVPLAAATSGKSYVAQLDSAMLLSSDRATAPTTIVPTRELEVIASHKGTEIARATTKIQILPDVHELLQPRSQPEVLEQLADATGGRVFRSAQELTASLLTISVTPGDSVVTRQPIWDSPLTWFVMLGLLAIEWTLRRLSGYG
jgi:uncharacterized membrane protein